MFNIFWLFSRCSTEAVRSWRAQGVRTPNKLMGMLVLFSLCPSRRLNGWELWWSSLWLICQSQLSLISGSALSVTKPFLITEHWKTTDPLSRPPIHPAHPPSLYTFLQLKKDISNAKTNAKKENHLIHLTMLSSCLSNYCSSDSKFVTFLHVGTSPLSCRVCAVTQTPKEAQMHIIFFISSQRLLPFWHWLTVYLFVACRLVSLCSCQSDARMRWRLNAIQLLNWFPSIYFAPFRGA